MPRLPHSFRPAALFACISGFFVLAAGLHAVTLLATPKIEAGKDSVTLIWHTDVECGTRVDYGKSPKALDQRFESGVAADHIVTLTGLATDTTYFFSIGSARKKLGTGSFTTGTSGARAPAPPSESKEKPGLISGLLSKIGIGGSASAPSTAAAKAEAKRAPPARVTWANIGSLQDHFERHGRDFGATNADDYAAKAWLFREQARATALPMKLDADGTVRMWDGRTGSFAAYNRDGTTKTFFKPGSAGYWQRQPGRPITPAQLPFK